MTSRPSPAPNVPIPRMPTLVLFLLTVIAVPGGWLNPLVRNANGQGAGFGPSIGIEPTGNQYPNPQYYLALELFRTAELDRAIEAFEFSVRRTRRDINGHWIDAIPPYAMLGECQYRMGDLEGAMQSLDMVLKIAVRHRGWLARPVWNEALMPQVQISPKQYLWPAANAVNRLPLKRTMQFYSGEQLTEQRLALGGSIEELNIKSVDVVEVLRGIAIASYRRRIILGPLAEGDPWATQALESTKYPAGLQLPLARNLIGAMRSAERFGAMQDDRAMTDAAETGMFNGSVHPISPITGLCAASAIAGTDKPNTAVPVCLAVANQAASMDAFEWVGEALQLGAGCAGPNEAAMIQQAGQVAANNLLRESRLAALHCLIAAADAAVTAGDLASANNLLADAKSLAVRRDVLQPRLEAYGAYVATRIATRSGSNVTGNINATLPWGESLSQMLAFATDNKARKRNLISMPRLYQLQRLRLSLGPKLKGLSVDGLLDFYSKPPAIDVWRRDPVDAIAGTMADRTSLRLSRLRTAAARESGVDVFARIEDLQTGKIANQLALGGRVLQTHALGRMPDELLDKRAADYRKVAPKVIRDFHSAVKTAAAERPAAGADPNLQTAKLNQLERTAWSIALDRHDLPTVMPHTLDDRQPTQAIPQGVAVLTFYLDDGTFHVVLATKQKSTYWSIKNATRVNGEIARLTRGIGATKSRGGRLPQDDSFREIAVGLRDQLIVPGTGPLLEGRLQGIDHLVVIPDGLLWYVPFELLPVEEPESELLGDAIKVTYAATPSLALFPTAERRDQTMTAVVPGKIFAPGDLEKNASLVASVVDALPNGGSVVVPGEVALPTSRLGKLAGHLLVADTTTPIASSILETRLANYESVTARGTLRDWMGATSPVPGSVFLSAFRSHLDTRETVSGAEILQTLAALQYSGTRDVVLSRWAVGGESTALLLREYAQELPFLGTADAFARAKSVLRRTELSPTAEPTLLGSDLEREKLSGDEPFFWSSYLLATPLN